ncbi:hypothetical protein [Streptomyces diastaticus]|uniref:hypothetical protein n=1 Tax=Streptomyces diastaticus TaxID=1956 RepID=UPI003657E90F
MRHHADYLVRGTTALAGQYVRWLAGEGFQAGAARLAGSGLGGVFGGMLIAGSPGLMWPATALGVIAAWRAGRPVEEVPDGAEGEEEAPEKAPEEAPLPTREELAVALHAVADPHAHTAAVATHLGVPAERVRAGLKAAGIPTSGGVRMRGAVSTGVKAAHFPPLGPVPENALLRGPDQQQQHNNVGVHSSSGVTVISTPDPEQPHRTHVTVLKGAG